MTVLWRLSGAGNDFLAQVEPPQDPAPTQIRAWCQRGVSLGADGVFVLRRLPGATRDRVVRMEHYNADGGRARLCVNGTRAAARLAFHLGWSDGQVSIETDAGPILARQIDDEVVELAPPVPPRPARSYSGPEDPRIRSGWFQTIGVPHVVLLWTAPLGDCPLHDLAPSIRRDPALGSEGANVDFVTFPSAHAVQIRTYERGVEGETLACGSGILAAVACGVEARLLEFPIEVEVASGCRLTVDGQSNGGRIVDWTLRGDARLIGRIEVAAGAERVPTAPNW